MKAINTLYETIGLNIRKLRQAKNITQQALSDSVDLTRTSLVHIEKGQQRLTIERLYKISNILNVSIEKILPLRYKDKDNITENYINQNIEFTELEQKYLKEMGLKSDQENTLILDDKELIATINILIEINPTKQEHKDFIMEFIKELKR